MQELIQEIKITLDNAFPFYKITPKEQDRLLSGHDLNDIRSAYSFKVMDYDYVVIYTSKKYIHFWNRTLEVDNPDQGDDILSSDLSILDNDNVYKLISTVFAIIARLSYQGNTTFVINAPDFNAQRVKIYKRLFMTNAERLFPHLTCSELPMGVILQAEKPADKFGKEVSNESRSLFAQFIKSITHR